VADPGAYTKEELAKLRGHIISNLERVWELLGGSEDHLTGTIYSDIAGADAGAQDNGVNITR
jgi:hypothetical protein